MLGPARDNAGKARGATHHWHVEACVRIQEERRASSGPATSSYRAAAAEAPREPRACQRRLMLSQAQTMVT